MTTLEKVQILAPGPAKRGAPTTIARLFAASDGEMEIERARDAQFATVERRWVAAGPIIEDWGDAGFGLPLDGRTRHWRVRDNGDWSTVVSATPPDRARLLPKTPGLRTTGTPVSVGRVPGRTAWLPQTMWAEGVDQVAGLLLGRICSPFLLRTVDPWELAATVVRRAIPSEERRRLDLLAQRRFPALGYIGQVMEWWLRIAWELPDEIVWGRAETDAASLDEAGLQQLMRTGAADGLRLIQQLPLTTERVAADWAAAHIWPGGVPRVPADAPAMPGSLFATRWASASPTLVAYAADGLPAPLTEIARRDVIPADRESRTEAAALLGGLLGPVGVLAGCPDALPLTTTAKEAWIPAEN